MFSSLRMFQCQGNLANLQSIIKTDFSQFATRVEISQFFLCAYLFPYHFFGSQFLVNFHIFLVTFSDENVRLIFDTTQEDTQSYLEILLLSAKRRESY